VRGGEGETRGWGDKETRGKGEWEKGEKDPPGRFYFNLVGV